MSGLCPGKPSDVPRSIPLQYDLGDAMATVGTIRPSRPAPAPADELHRCGRATFAVRQPSSTRAAGAIVGEIDAVNGRELGRYVERQTGMSKQLVLDLRARYFFRTQPFTALHYIRVRCARPSWDWVIFGSHTARRLLAISDP